MVGIIIRWYFEFAHFRNIITESMNKPGWMQWVWNMNRFSLTSGTTTNCLAFFDFLNFFHHSGKLLPLTLASAQVNETCQWHHCPETRTSSEGRGIPTPAGSSKTLVWVISPALQTLVGVDKGCTVKPVSKFNQIWKKELTAAAQHAKSTIRIWNQTEFYDTQCYCIIPNDTPGKQGNFWTFQ